MPTTQPVIEPAKEQFLISRMTEHDLLDVVEIEEQSGLSRWGWNAYYSELHGPNYKFMLVARQRRDRQAGADPIVGYIVARVAASEVHINNVAVADDCRRKGLGSALLREIIDAARENGATVAFLEVRTGNGAAQALYEKCGFKAVARRPSYYSSPVEDALVMSLVL